MKLKLVRPDGTILEVEGTVEECAAVAGLASLDLRAGPAPSIFHYHYHYHGDVPASYPWAVGWPTFTLNSGHQALLLQGHVVDGEALGDTVNGN